MRAYIAGPMRNRPLFNFPAFDEAAAAMRSNGWEVFNPAEHDRETLGLNPSDYPTGCFKRDQGWCDESIRRFMRNAMAWDTARIIESDAIVLLPGWETSSGVMEVELPLAKFLGLSVIILGKAELEAA